MKGTLYTHVKEREKTKFVSQMDIALIRRMDIVIDYQSAFLERRPSEFFQKKKKILPDEKSMRYNSNQ